MKFSVFVVNYADAMTQLLFNIKATKADFLGNISPRIENINAWNLVDTDNWYLVPQ